MCYTFPLNNTFYGPRLLCLQQLWMLSSCQIYGHDPFVPSYIIPWLHLSSLLVQTEQFRCLGALVLHERQLPICSAAFCKVITHQ